MHVINEDAYLKHYGILRKSGRYPWGSGQTPGERSTAFREEVARLRKEMTDKQIADGFGMNTTEFRNAITLSRNIQKQEQIQEAVKLKEKGMSNTEIAAKMFGSRSKESNVRDLLRESTREKAEILTNTADVLRKRVDEGLYIDIGSGVENQLGIAKTKLNAAVSTLKDEGYVVHRLKVKQLGTNHETTVKVLTPPGTKWSDVNHNQNKIEQISVWSTDGGRTFFTPKPPLSIDSKRVGIRYKEDGGDQADGVIYVRPGVKDLDMGGAHYAQVRIGVDGTHYLKGMAVQRDDLPPGVDLLFNTNKERASSPSKHSVMKPMKDDPENPFGASIARQILDADGKRPTSVMNIVNEESNWDDWSRNLSSQMLSKQKPALVKQQLDLTYAKKKADLDEILSLTNPVVKARLLQSYSDDMDASAVHLKAAAMPRQKTHVILPINSLKDNEVYAPGYNNGETVVLIRYPHGGKFEIPELQVNNRNPEGNKIIKPGSTAAIGINHRVAARLSGADFDGDTVVVIPNNRKQVQNESPLLGLKDFDPQVRYRGSSGKDAKGNPIMLPGVKRMKNTQTEMGKISNLITDMTIAGANHTDLAAAVRHSMVVIDAEKHGLDYRRSYQENGISALQKKYQPNSRGGTTLISRSNGKVTIPDRKLRPASEGGPIDRKTGELVYVPTGKTRDKRGVDKETGEVTWTPVPKTTKVKRGSLVKDAYEITSGPREQITPVERQYADYSNKVRQLANKARLEMINQPKQNYSPSAAKVYKKEVDSLNAKLDIALKNAPLERQAQVIANYNIKVKRQANPDLDADQLKKLESLELAKARNRTGADKQRVQITNDEWAAIQAGAITTSKLESILANADIDQVKKLATPKSQALMSTTNVQRAKALAEAGYTQAEIADELGVSLTTLKTGLKG